MMNKILFWNIISINSQQDFERLTNLNRINQYWMIGLMEPFEDSNKIYKYRHILKPHSALTNNNDKIWLFTREKLQVNTIADTTQHLIVIDPSSKLKGGDYFFYSV